MARSDRVSHDRLGPAVFEMYQVCARVCMRVCACVFAQVCACLLACVFSQSPFILHQERVAMLLMGGTQRLVVDGLDPQYWRGQVRGRGNCVG